MTIGGTTFHWSVARSLTHEKEPLGATTSLRMNQRGKNLVQLALSNSTKSILSHNSEVRVSPSNLDDPTKASLEQDDNIFEKQGNFPFISFAADETYEQKGVEFHTGDFTGTDSGDEYMPGPHLRSSSSSSSSTSSSGTSVENNNCNDENLVNECNEPAQSITTTRGRRRTRNPTTWKKNVAKRLKNTGQAYISVKTKKLNQGKTMGPTCTSKCRLSCASKFTEQKRTEIFESYWKLESIERQRDYLNACTRTLKCTYRRIKPDKKFDRKENSAFYLLNENKDIRVCKTFLINTLGITQRIIRNVIDSRAQNGGFISSDRRGKHGKQCTLQPTVIQAVKDHIESIPKVQSHYLRASTSRQYIDGGLTVAELHRNYSEIQKQNNNPIVTYDAYLRIFNQDFNIGFFKPKKDRCDECEAYENASEEEKIKLRDSFKLHQEEKSLSRHEKDRDMRRCHEPENNTIVLTYDLQTVLPCPVGKSSSFYYKSRLNCYNLTITNAKKQETTCYFWHEGLANRGAIEIGSCVFKYLEQIAFEKPGCDVIMYSDNCCGQQKNRFVFAMYHYAVNRLNINSIQHNFLIRGHTQNEGDTAHSVIEKSVTRAKNAGCIYVPDQYISLIRGAKKTGNPFVVNEMNFDDFFDLKSLAENMNFNMSKNVNGCVIKTGDIKSIKFTKNSDNYQYRTTYKTNNWEEANAVVQPKKLRGSKGNRSIGEIELKAAYNNKIPISDRKKRDLLQLVEANLVPRYYASFYNNLI